MDLIYMNANKEDIGVLKDYTLDMAFGSDENNFECTVSASNNVCEAGFYLYAEGTEYGGVIDSINVDTENETVIYKGRTWHGILESKVFEPDAGQDYLEVSGEANSVLATLISRMGLGDMFTVSEEASGIEISHKMNRYVKGYTGILRMLKANGAKLNVIFKNGFVELSAEPFVDYNQDEQFDTDQISFTIEKNYKPINHVICLGQGDLKDRRVIHLYADGVGNISGTQTFTGVDEVTEIFDYPNAESDAELIEGGVEIIKASWASDTIEFEFESDDESFDINDVIGAKEFVTGTEVIAHITKKIIQIKDYTTAISYSCESGVGTVASSGYPSSGSGGSSGIVVDAYTKAETDAMLNGKSDTGHTHDEYFTEAEVNTALANYIPLAGSTAITGTLRTSGELQSTVANGFRMVQGNYGFLIRNDGSTIYFMFTASGDQYGGFNSLRPLYINASNGAVGMGNGLSVSGTLTANNALTVKGNTTVARLDSSSTIHIAGVSYLNGGVQVNANGTAIKLIKGGTTVISASGTSVKLLTLATVKGWYSSVDVTHTAIIVNNGDAVVNGVHIEDVSWHSGNSAWYATFNASTTGNIRINYTVICW